MRRQQNMNSISARFKGRMSAKKDVDMTEGNILSHIIKFSIPLLLGNLFQQLYNTVDTWVVGNYVGDDAFAAVGNIGPIINLLIGLFLGLSTGASVVISQYYGAKDEKHVQDTVHTAIAMTLILSVVFAVVGIALTPLLLKLMKMNAATTPEATTYLVIYFAGIVGLLIYNMGSGIMRAIGDSRRPFYFLVCSALTNTILDLVFVIVFRMGVAGVALATVAAQCLSAVLVIITLVRSDGYCKLHLKKLRIDMKCLGQIFRVGIPAALQMAITSFSNIFVQGYINFFDNPVSTGCMGGWTAYSKIDQFLLLPMQSIALASTTFVGQNLGVNKVERAKKGVRASLLVSSIFTVVLIVPVVVFAEPLVSFFNPTPNVVEHGALFLRLISPFYVFCCINQILSGSLRGAGDSKAPMIIMLGCFVVFRQIYLFVMTKFFINTPVSVALGYPAGWMLCSAICYIYFRKSNWEKHRLVKDVGSQAVSEAEAKPDGSEELPEQG